MEENNIYEMHIQEKSEKKTTRTHNSISHILSYWLNVCALARACEEEVKSKEKSIWNLLWKPVFSYACTRFLQANRKPSAQKTTPTTELCSRAFNANFFPLSFQLNIRTVELGKKIICTVTLMNELKLQRYWRYFHSINNYFHHLRFVWN